MFIKFKLRQEQIIVKYSNVYCLDVNILFKKKNWNTFPSLPNYDKCIWSLSKCKCFGELYVIPCST